MKTFLTITSGESKPVTINSGEFISDCLRNWKHPDGTTTRDIQNVGTAIEQAIESRLEKPKVVRVNV